MALYSDWEALAQQERTQTEHEAFWNAYFDKETAAYQQILSQRANRQTGALHDLAQAFSMEDTEFAGFLDGVNTSLTQPIELESLEAESALDFTIDFEKLFYNMHKAKAPWLYGLEEWDGVLDPEKRHEIARAYKEDQIYHKQPTVGRNDPCPCGSGKKYKKCCGANA